MVESFPPSRQVISALLGLLNADGVRPTSATEWQCIAVWAVAGWWLSTGAVDGNTGIVDVLGAAIHALDGAQPPP